MLFSSGIRLIILIPGRAPGRTLFGRLMALRLIGGFLIAPGVTDGALPLFLFFFAFCLFFSLRVGGKLLNTLLTTWGRLLLRVWVDGELL